MTDGYVVNNHGDRFRPLTGATFPFHMTVSWDPINGGDPNYPKNPDHSLE